MLDTALPTASWARRFAALVVDWIVSTLVVITFVGGHDYFATGSRDSLWTLVVYVLESALFTWLLGGSFGKLCVGLRVLPSEGPPRPLNPIVLIIRQVLVALVIPPLIFRPDGRGLHDLMARTVTVNLATFNAVVRPPSGKRT